MLGIWQLVVLVLQWCVCPSWPVASTVYATALELPVHVTRTEWLKHTRLALTFSGAHGTGK